MNNGLQFPATGEALDRLGEFTFGIKRKRYLFFFKESDSKYRARLIEAWKKAFT